MTITTAEIPNIIARCHQARQPVLFVGPTGIGKTESCKRYAIQTGMVPVILDLTTMEPVDLIGMPYISPGEERKTCYAMPEWFPDDKPIVLIIDEINRADTSMLNTLLTLLTERKVGPHRLHEGTVIIACMNPSEGDYEYIATKPLDAALSARFCRIEVRADAVSWLRYAQQQKVHESVIAFITESPDSLNDGIANPRSWSAVSKIIAASFVTTPNELCMPIIGGLVGEEMALTFLRAWSKRLAGDYNGLIQVIRACAKGACPIPRARTEVWRRLLQELSLTVQSKAELAKAMTKPTWRKGVKALLLAAPRDLIDASEDLQRLAQDLH